MMMWQTTIVCFHWFQFVYILFFYFFFVLIILQITLLSSTHRIVQIESIVGGDITGKCRDIFFSCLVAKAGSLVRLLNWFVGWCCENILEGATFQMAFWVKKFFLWFVWQFFAFNTDLAWCCSSQVVVVEKWYPSTTKSRMSPEWRYKGVVNSCQKAVSVRSSTDWLLYMRVVRNYVLDFRQTFSVSANLF